MTMAIQKQSLKRKRVAATFAAALVLLLVGNVNADEKLPQANGCVVCHIVEKKRLGPAYSVVAATYKDDKTAALS
jgi:cytochrome c